MVLIHDDDLVRIQGDLQPDALMGHLQSSKPVIKYALYGLYLPILRYSASQSRTISLLDCPSAIESNSGMVTVKVAMLSDEFRELCLPRQGTFATQKIKVYSNHVEVKLDQKTVHHYDGTCWVSFSCHRGT